MTPNGAGSCFFPTYPDLANILGDTDFDFENFYFWDFYRSQISRFPNSRAGPHPFCCNISSATGNFLSEETSYAIVVSTPRLTPSLLDSP